VKSSISGVVTITHVVYDFLSLLSSSEPLVCRGKRLQETLQQRLTPTYAPDVILKVDVVEADHRLLVQFVAESSPAFYQGETRKLTLWMKNAGTHPIREVWMVNRLEDEISIGDTNSANGKAWENICLKFKSSVSSSSVVLQHHSDIQFASCRRTMSYTSF
jgi:trafficking protein particle complex subunit 8